MNEEAISSTHFKRIFLVKDSRRGSFEVTEQQPIRNSVESRLDDDARKVSGSNTIIF